MSKFEDESCIRVIMKTMIVPFGSCMWSCWSDEDIDFMSPVCFLVVFDCFLRCMPLSKHHSELLGLRKMSVIALFDQLREWSEHSYFTASSRTVFFKESGLSYFSMSPLHVMHVSMNHQIQSIVSWRSCKVLSCVDNVRDALATYELRLNALVYSEEGSSSRHSLIPRPESEK